jgi:hypothetical protein
MKINKLINKILIPFVSHLQFKVFDALKLQPVSKLVQLTQVL